MTNKEILQKAIDKAEKNSDKKFYYFSSNQVKELFWSQLGEKIIKSDNHLKIIFSHDFAKAFWGEEFVCELCGYEEGHPNQCLEWAGYMQNWKYHLQKMILEKEPLKYLERFL